jgi:hypothetical protein
MSSLKSGALLSLFSGFSLEAIQRASQKRETTSYDHYPSPLEIAYAARFSGPAQVSVTKVAAANSNVEVTARDAA